MLIVKKYITSPVMQMKLLQYSDYYFFSENERLWDWKLMGQYFLGELIKHDVIVKTMLKINNKCKILNQFFKKQDCELSNLYEKIKKSNRD